jgi:hypothetical protein
MRFRLLFLALAAALIVPRSATVSARAGQYQHFAVSIYTRYQEVQQMIDHPDQLAANWDRITRQLKVDKIYLELTRNHDVVTPESGLDTVKKFFTDHGVQVAAGLGLTVQESAGFQSYDYVVPADRAFVQHVSEMAARHFDEIILDDFFFYNTKTDADIAAKGTRSWTAFRLATMDDVSENLIIKPAKAVNPRVKVVIKFPNWYDHFSALGYDLDKEPKLFDGIYTGTETRQPVGDQHLQQYESFQIMRYFEHLKPNGNGGGWVDTGGATTIDRYAEQFWNTVWAKRPEMTLFDYRQVLSRFPRNGGDRPWASEPTSLTLDAVVKKAGGDEANATWAAVAGAALEQADTYLGRLGTPVGVKSYKPYQSIGEDFLQNYLGMIGVPMDVYPSFPSDASLVFLTEQAKYDPAIVTKIKQQLVAGKSVCVTYNLFKALQGKGIEDIVELELPGRSVPVHEYGGRGFGPAPAVPAEPLPSVSIPEIRPFTNDSWSVISATSGGTTYPILVRDAYSKGTLYVFAVPDNPADLYNLPANVLTSIRTTLSPADAAVRIVAAPPRVALFPYDNGTFIVENYTSDAADVTVSVAGTVATLHELVGNQDVTPAPAAPARGRGFGFGGAGRGGPAAPPRTTFALHVLPHSYLVLSSAP